MSTRELAFAERATLYTRIAALLYPESPYSQVLINNTDNAMRWRPGHAPYGLHTNNDDRDDALYELWLDFNNSTSWSQVEVTALALIHEKYPGWPPRRIVNAAVIACMDAGEIGTAASIMIDELK